VLRYCAEEFVCDLTDRMIGRGWRLGLALVGRGRRRLNHCTRREKNDRSRARAVKQRLEKSAANFRKVLCLERVCVSYFGVD
jgi:hypothetical protein